MTEGGLGLSSGYYEDAYHFSSLNYGMGHNSDWNFFFGDKIGCIGETSAFACLLGALYLIYTGVGSWRTMVAMGLGALPDGLCFEMFSKYSRRMPEHGILPSLASRHTNTSFSEVCFRPCLYGYRPGLFAVSAAGQMGLRHLLRIITIVIRVINPAYPEGVMLAILMGNVFAPLFDYYAAHSIGKGDRRVSEPQPNATAPQREQQFQHDLVHGNP